MSQEYVLTEEERKLLRECEVESLLYRALPFSVISMAGTQALIVRGTLPRAWQFGSLAFAGLASYLVGKLSYSAVCREKFIRLESSPLGEVLRRASGMPQQFPKGPQSELSVPDTQSFDTMFQPAEPQSHPRDSGYGYNPEPPVQMGRADDFSFPVQSYVEEEEEPKKKPIRYEDLRLKNRQNYEVTLIQKADTVEPERPKKEVKKNIYGDTWEE